MITSSSSTSSSPKSATVRATVARASTFELHEDEKTDVATDVKRRAQGFFDTLRQRTIMLRQNLTRQAWLFIVNVALSAALLLSVSCSLLWEAFDHQHRFQTVGEDYGLNLCSFRHFQVYLTASACYSISDLMIGCVFALWYAFRAVRHEKEALLVVFSLVVLGVVGRALYSAFVTAGYWVTGLDLTAVQVVLCIGSVGFVVAVAQTWRVGRSFGWRMYTKGVASVADVRRMGKLKTLDAAAKLDLFLTVNAFNTFFFFAPDTTIRYIGFAFTAITAIFLLAIPVMIKKQMLYVAYIFAVVGLVLPAFYIFLLVTIFEKDPNHCYDLHLLQCTAEANITQIYKNLSFTTYPALFNSTGCIDCRDDKGFDPDRLCWTNGVWIGNYWNASEYNVSDLPFNASLREDFISHCVNESYSFIDSCCAEFGKCELKTKLVDSNAPMAIFVVICAIMARLATMYYGVQQARMLDVPTVEELISRGSRSVSNALSFQFLGSGSPPTTARYRNNEMEHDDDHDTARPEGGGGGDGRIHHHEHEINHHHHTNTQQINATLSADSSSSSTVMNDVPGVKKVGKAKSVNDDHHEENYDALPSARREVAYAE